MRYRKRKYSQKSTAIRSKIRVTSRPLKNSGMGEITVNMTAKAIMLKKTQGAGRVWMAIVSPLVS